MSASRKRSRQRATILGGLVGGMIIFTFVVSLIAPDIGTRTSVEDDFPTFTPFGTPPPPTEVIIPTPDPDPRLEGELPYIHSSGYFQTFRPAGADWAVDDNAFDQTSARLSVVFQSNQRLAVIHNYIEPGVEYESLQSLSDNFLTTDYYAGEWARYDSWEITNRQVTDDAVIVDFNLISLGQNYLGRDVVRLQDDWLYVTRLVAPSNNAALLDRLQALIQPAFFAYPELQALPREWPAYIDQQYGFIFKHPPGWQYVAGSPGRPATLTLPPGEPQATLRLWAEVGGPLDSAEQAGAYVQEIEPTAEIVQSEPVESMSGSGFQVAYRFRDQAGDAHSGLAVLLDDGSSAVYIANLRVDEPGVNLLDVENLAAEYAEIRQAVIGGFVVLPPESRAALATPVPEATSEAPDAATAEATVEAETTDAAVEPETTAEVEATAMTEVEATGEATEAPAE